MKRRTLLLAAAAVALVAPVAGAAEDAEAPQVRVYLPRSVFAEKPGLTLGAVTVVHCADADLAKRASAIAMGRAPMPGERIDLARRTILSRLASNGLAGDRVRVTGAKVVSVRRKEKAFEAERIIASAEAVLKKAAEDDSVAWQLRRDPKPLRAPMGENAGLTARLADDAPGGYAKVVVTVEAGGEAHGRRELLFRRMYRVRQAVATKQIDAGQAVTRDNAEVGTVLSDRPQKRWTPPFGLLVTQRLRKGTVLRPGVLRKSLPEVSIKRNQAVLMKVEGPGFKVTALGTALQNGRAGEFIKVRNVDSKRVIAARVGYDGTVEPVFDEGKP